MKLWKHITERWLVRIIATLTGSMGLINLVSAGQPALADCFAILEK
jgi:hypothetical protein